MRVLGIVAVHALISGAITASLIPVLVLIVPALRGDSDLGLGVTAGVFAGCFALLALTWPWRK